MKFTAEQENWNVYRLEDGSEIKVRVILVSVKRRAEQFQENGDPVYDLNMQQIMHMDCPEHLKLQAPTNQTKQ
jgi:hypothetical protein